MTNIDALASAKLAANQAAPFDAIVVGSGAAGGLAALLLAEAGLRVLVLERAATVGGRMLAPRHGWQYYRLSANDLKDWPLQAGELDPWYAAVERRLELSGARDGLPDLPDSEIAHPLECTVNEQAMQDAVAQNWGVKAVIGRFAPPLASLAAAERFGRVKCVVGAYASRVVVKEGRAVGVEWSRDGARQGVAYAPLIFLGAGALNTTRLLLRSLGAGSPALGHYLMDHIKVTMRSWTPALRTKADNERRRCLYVLRHDDGFSIQIYQRSLRFGTSLGAVAFGNMAPRAENRVTQSDITLKPDPTESRRARLQARALREVARMGNAKLRPIASPKFGRAEHECGSARMGTDPRTSVLNAHNEVWGARGLFVIDAASFPSQAAVNPTLTIMALAARACHYAVQAWT